MVADNLGFLCANKEELKKQTVKSVYFKNNKKFVAFMNLTVVSF